MRIFLAVCLMFLMTVTNAQTQPKNRYTDQWKKVYALIDKGQPKSALTVVDDIAKTARANKDEVQLLRVVIARSELKEAIREDNGPLSINEWISALPSFSKPAAAILKMKIAEQYAGIYQNDRWQIDQRTTVTANAGNDPGSWDAATFRATVLAWIDSSLSEKRLLAATPATAFEELGLAVNYQAPTLYSVLLYRSLQLMTNMAPRDRASNAFFNEAPEAFASNPVFASWRPPVSDSNDLQFKTVQRYQQLTTHLIAVKDTNALNGLELNRLESMYAQSVSDLRDSLFVSALQRMIRERRGRGGYAAGYRLAAFWTQNNMRVMHPDSTLPRRAVSLLAPMIADSVPAWPQLAQARALWASLHYRQLSLTVETAIVPEAPARVLISYRNLAKTWLRLYAVPVGTSYDDQMELWKKLPSWKPLRQWNTALPGSEDLYEHRVEWKLDALPAGEYLLVAQNEENFRTDSTVAAAATVRVSNLAMVSSGATWYVLHRNTGAPLEGVQASIYRRQYNSGRRGFENILAEKIRSGRDGVLRYGRLREGNHSIVLALQKDSLQVDQYSYYEYRYGQEEQRSRKKIDFFTDRAIYRPGQTVFFKGIVVQQKKGSAVPDAATVTVLLWGANGNALDTLRLQPNEFGSVQGKFRLPLGGLTGPYRISSVEADGDGVFSMEEYKRPKFEVRFDTVRNAWRLGDSVKISGKALSYSGPGVGGAKIRYHVTRRPQPMPWEARWSKEFYPVSGFTEITSGEATTNADGSFTISFPAKPDRTIRNKDINFFFEVTVAVTDPNGETRENETALTIGQHRLAIEADVPDEMAAADFRKLPIRVTNSTGQAQKVPIRVRLTTLLPEQRLMRERYWRAPDRALYTKQQYLSWFPHDIYADEDNAFSWPKGPVALAEGTVTEPGKEVALNTPVQPGFYELLVEAHGSDGDTTRLIRIIELTAPGKQLRPEYLTVKSPATAQPGDTVQLELRSALPALHVHHASLTMENGLPRKDSELLVLQGARVIGQKITESNRGGTTHRFFAVADNRFHNVSESINIPWSNKDLQVSVLTARDRAEPGSRERWKLQVRGAKAERLAAEMVATLYDASLDQFVRMNWLRPSWHPTLHEVPAASGGRSFGMEESAMRHVSGGSRSYWWDNFTGAPFVGDLSLNGFRYRDSYKFNVPARAVVQEVGMGTFRAQANSPKASFYRTEAADSAAPSSGENITMNKDRGNISEPAPAMPKRDEGQPEPVSPRRNFNETAFFYPQLRTDTAGNIDIEFTLPELLTRWKFLAFAHTKDLASGMTSSELTTQKKLMVQPNLPRFVRQGDHFEVVARVVNMTDKELTGQAQLELFDAATGTPVDGWFNNFFPNQYFTADSNGSATVVFPIEVPYLYNSSLTWRITARSGNIADAEENTIPVLTNKVLLTETLPMTMKGSGTKTFKWEKLLASGESESIQHHAFTIEYTANPAWSVIQALPYLMEFPYECAEQTWNRYYANALAAHIVRKLPKVKSILERWQASDTSAFRSKLEANPELKTALLEETPWVLEARNETEQRRNIAQLYDLVQLAAKQSSALAKLAALQLDDGSFPWFRGDRGSLGLTLYIVDGLARLKLLGLAGSETEAIRNRALSMIDREMTEGYNRITQQKNGLKNYRPSGDEVEWIYARSVLGRPDGTKTTNAFNFYLQRIADAGFNLPLRHKALAAAALQRLGNATAAAALLRSLRETAITNDELGMYWKENSFGRSTWWGNAPIETQAAAIEAFATVGRDDRSVDALRTWLLRNKQTNNWRTTTATADACYALLLRGSDWLAETPSVRIDAGGQTIINTEDAAGAGYAKKTVTGAGLTPQLGAIALRVGKTSATVRPSWGAAYWQYFEDIDKVVSAGSGLTIQRKLFCETRTERGAELAAIDDTAGLRVGDRLVVRLVVSTDRDLEYVHLKDQRASCFEPVNVLSTYRWQGALGYYESTRDASTNFFISLLPKGKHVLEYPVYITSKGNFVAGLATIQCMYAPEFSAHSEGQTVNVD